MPPSFVDVVALCPVVGPTPSRHLQLAVISHKSRLQDLGKNFQMKKLPKEVNMILLILLIYCEHALLIRMNEIK